MTADEFLPLADRYQLGMLDTERPHPKTTSLATWARDDLPRALAALQEVDVDALSRLRDALPQLVKLGEAVRETLAAGNRVYLAGCGATGRLSLALEIFARQGLLPEEYAGQIIGFMAGGDAALIRSIERFEDRPDYGARQLAELGFADGDLLLASTEGGETPFVIGATLHAAKHSSRAPFFLYCNPDEELIANVERSRQVLEHPGICKVNLSVGPMALSGSTRMQASTVLMAGIGWAMKSPVLQDLQSELDRFREWMTGLDWSFLATFIETEAETYEAGEYVVYEPGPYGITVLTDTTERSPTFTLTPFERSGEPEPASLCYLLRPDTQNAMEAWKALLGRSPRPLEWGELRHLTNAEAMAKFDFSIALLDRRSSRTNRAPHHLFQLARSEAGIEWKFRNLQHTLPVPEGIDFFGENLALKLLLNAHSTLVMGRLGRYEDNLMTYVSPNNCKLIDRCIRYVRLLLQRHHKLEPSYEHVARVLLGLAPDLKPNEPIVLKTVDSILAEES